MTDLKLNLLYYLPIKSTLFSVYTKYLPLRPQVLSVSLYIKHHFEIPRYKVSQIRKCTGLSQYKIKHLNVKSNLNVKIYSEYLPRVCSVAAPHLWNNLPYELGQHLWLAFANPYWRHNYFRSNNLVLRHEHSCGMAQYTSNDWLITYEVQIGVCFDLRLSFCIYMSCIRLPNIGNDLRWPWTLSYQRTMSKLNTAFPKGPNFCQCLPRLALEMQGFWKRKCANMTSGWRWRFNGQKYSIFTKY